MTAAHGKGWVAVIEGEFPVQATGTVDGQPFYFRARGNGWHIRIAGVGEDPLDEDAYVVEARWCKDPYAAGAMSHDQAKNCINAGLTHWRRHRVTQMRMD